MSHSTHVNESQHTSEWVTALKWTSHSTQVNQSQRTWMSHSIRTVVDVPITQMSHATHLNTWWHTSEWVTAHIWTSRGTRTVVISLSLLIHLEWVTTHIWISHSTRAIVISYGVASTSRLLKMISLFCKRALQKRRYSAKETYNFKEPTNQSHPIALLASEWESHHTWLVQM